MKKPKWQEKYVDNKTYGVCHHFCPQDILKEYDSSFPELHAVKKLHI